MFASALSLQRDTILKAVENNEDEACSGMDSEVNSALQMVIIIWLVIRCACYQDSSKINEGTPEVGKVGEVVQTLQVGTDYIKHKALRTIDSCVDIRS